MIGHLSAQHVVSARRLASLVLLAACAMFGVSDRAEGQTSATAAVVHPPHRRGGETRDHTARLVIDLRVPLRDDTGGAAAADALAVDPWGRIYVLDRRAGLVRLFDANGRAVRVVGRPDRGVAGLTNPIGVMTDRSGAVWVVEPGARRYVVFDSGGRLIATYPRQALGTPTMWRGGFDTRGRLYDTDLSSVAGHNVPAPLRCSARAASCERVSLVDQQQGATFDAMGGGARITAAVPFTGEPIWQLDGEGGVWVGRSDRFRLVHYDQDGRVRGEVQHAVVPSLVSREERAAAIAGLSWFTRQGGRVDTARFGRERPPIKALIVDDEAALWVRLSAPPASSRTVFERYASDGRRIGRAESDVLPESFQILVVRHHLYTVTRTQAGPVTLVRLRIAT
jgi:hypothetical protein